MKRVLAALLILPLLWGAALAELDVVLTGESGVVSEETAGPEPTPWPTGTLSYGATGEIVTLLQEALTELGYYTFRITGNYQENTRKAVREFQQDNGLEATGAADPALQQLILSGTARPRPTPTPVPTPTPRSTLSPELLPYEKPLEYGLQGDDRVALVQERLQALGYYTIDISGNFLKNTRRALVAFQAKNGLTADGVVGEATWNLLFSGAQVLDAAATPTPSPTPPPPEYMITVDTVNQIVSVYTYDETGAYTRLVRNMICSTGTAKFPTPEQTYTLNGRTARWCYFPEWGSHAQYWTRISSSIAFHSVIYYDPNPMNLDVKSYKNLGSPASHGCIRLLVDDARWIYQNCGKGTQVIIFKGEPDPELTESLKPPALDRSVMLPQVTAAPTPAPLYDSKERPPFSFRTLQVGSTGEDVFWLQSKLTELGHYTGTITGGYYQGTRDAVKAYQQAMGLSTDGKAGRKTQESLYAEVLATPTPSPSPTPTPTPIPTPTPVPGQFTPEPTQEVKISFTAQPLK